MTTPAGRDVRTQPIVTATIEGPVPALDWSYAVDELRKVSDGAPHPLCRVHARLISDATTHPRPVAIADCVVLPEGGTTAVVAGAAGTTMRAAVDELIARLQRRFEVIASRDLERSKPIPANAEEGIPHDQYR